MALVILILKYVAALIVGGIICFYFLFPMIGQWLKGLVKRLEDANKRMEQEREKILNQTTKRTYDDQKAIDGLYMDESDIKSAYERRWISPEDWEEEKFLDQCKERKDGKIDIQKLEDRTGKRKVDRQG
ncbi:unnamed protein product [marine sediment metagenome]|uniref:Uncharacterized protein n=1 Tax=marine sediment metagenome TaxID=412755 RepID=X1GZ68_9ZZZZ